MVGFFWDGGSAGGVRQSCHDGNRDKKVTIIAHTVHILILLLLPDRESRNVYPAVSRFVTRPGKRFAPGVD